MNLPDAPVAEQGFFVTHFLTVADQSRSKEFCCYMRDPDGYLIEVGNTAKKQSRVSIGISKNQNEVHQRVVQRRKDCKS